MSDFISRLINRHLGAGEKVLPRSQALFEANVEAISLPVEGPAITNLESIDRRHEQTIPKPIERGATLTQTGNPELNSLAAVNSPEPTVDRIFTSHESVTGTMPTLFSPIYQEPITAAGGKDAYLFPGPGDLSITGGIGKNLPVPGEQELLEQEQASDFSFSSTMNPTGRGFVTSMYEDQGTQVTPALPAWINSWQRKPSEKPALNDAQTGTNRVINVSIGRIEVRANRPAPEPLPQQKKSAGTAGIMTLEQYLNRRLKGGHL